MFWTRKKKSTLNNVVDQREAEVIEERKEIQIINDSRDPIFDGEGFMTVSDIIIKDFQNKGGFDDLPSKNKPLEVQSGDVFTSILKNANVLPMWVDLQHEIRDDIKKLLKTMTWQGDSIIQIEVENINKKIIRYNQIVPSSILQKPKVKKESLTEDYIKWT
jgi:hypothetical protein